MTDNELYCKKCDKYLGVSGCTAFCDEYCLDKYVTEQIQLSIHLLLNPPRNKKRKLLEPSPK